MPKKEFTDALLKTILDAVVAGATPEVAVVAAGVGRATYYRWRGKARNGDKEYIELFDKIEQAEAECEIKDIFTTQAAATNPEESVLECPDCGKAISWKLLQHFKPIQEALSSAAKNAFERLGRRFPRRWSPTVRHTVEDEQREFLDVAEEVLEPKIFRLLLGAYTSKVGPGAAPDSATKH